MIKKFTKPKFIHIMDNIYYEKYLFQRKNFKLVHMLNIDHYMVNMNYVDELQMHDLFISYEELDDIRKLLDPYCIEIHEFYHHDAYGDLYLRNLDCLDNFKDILSGLLIIKKFQ